ncbi:unnamed protein product [Rotaria sp. Silwood1]|nr:unnamed protein product [Rotaria sp. Silwood1]CAF3823588.1 unnamed protein product [Rotaria sp. Silwood1]CAF4718569.1 unnamed protein product [Rotaria sp. Silwood1]CAF4959454.1 unnamed protein product [Rotaria sp. Silwood1]
MWSIILLLFKLIVESLSNEDINNCYFNVFYSNGSSYKCLDEDCYQYIDIISLEDQKCQTNYLSLKFSSYLTYKNFLQLTSLKTPLASFFSKNHSNLERLLQIEFQTAFINDEPFKLNQLSLLFHSISYIDTYEFIFNGFIVDNNKTLFIDQHMFISDEQNIIDTLRLVFNCTQYNRVEWELVKSIQSLPQSPCPQQIQFITNHSIDNNQYYSHLIILIILITYLSIIIIIAFIIIGLFNNNYYLNHRLKQISQSNSQQELITIIQRF